MRKKRRPIELPRMRIVFKNGDIAIDYFVYGTKSYLVFEHLGKIPQHRIEEVGRYGRRK